jgi:hypothetical protein
MGELLDALIRLNEDRLDELAERGYEALRDILSRLPERWGKARLERLHEANRTNVLLLLRHARALSESAEELHRFWTRLEVRPDKFHDPSMLTDIAGLLSFLLERYVEAFSGKDRESVEDALMVALDVIADELVAACGPQVRAMGRTVFTTLHEPKVVADANRLLLVELPIGNSIPTRLLRQFLEKHDCNVETVRVSLCRNDSASRGLTRRRVLEENLRDTLRGGDLVILADEWLSGANFEAVSQHIGSVVRTVPNASFLPIGILAAFSSSDRHYLSHVRAHKKLVKDFGFGAEKSSRFRIVFPPLEVAFPRGKHLYFFWSEHDRLAGYRKAYPVTRCFAAVDSAVEKLMSNPEAWREAALRMLMHMAPEIRAMSGIPAREDEHADLFLMSLKRCYDDYKQVRRELQAIQHASSLGDCDDPVRAFHEVCKAIMEKIEGRPAVVCVGLGLALVEDDIGKDSGERNILDEHAPIVVETQLPRRCFHDRLMKKIVAAIES